MRVLVCHGFERLEGNLATLTGDRTGDDFRARIDGHDEELWITPGPVSGDLVEDSDLLERALSALVALDPSDSEARRALAEIRSEMFRKAVR